MHPWLARALACLVYVFPLSSATVYGGLIYAGVSRTGLALTALQGSGAAGQFVTVPSLVLGQVPYLEYLFYPFAFADAIFRVSIIDFISVGLVAWVATYAGVVRNYRLPDILRFNAAQALVLDIAIFLVTALLEIFGLTLGGIGGVFGFVTQLVFSSLFLGTTAAVAYSIFENLRGGWPNLPVISEAARSQVR